MKLLRASAVLALLCLLVIQSHGQLGFGSSLTSLASKSLGGLASSVLDVVKNPCDRNPDSKFQDALQDFTMRLTQKASQYNNGHFIISPTAIWLSMASIAEFSDKEVQGQLFTALNLPEEWCIRQKYYLLALGLETSGPDAIFRRSRSLAIDERAHLNEKWTAFSHPSGILKYRKLSFDRPTFELAHQTMGIPSRFNSFSGHSMILDRLDYEAFWTSAFSEGFIETGPFYPENGHQLTVEFMKMESRVRLAYIPFINAKVLELPVGSDGRYTMLLTMGVQNYAVQRVLELMRGSIIVNILSALTVSMVPIEVAVPRFSMSSAYDVRPILEDMDLQSIFNNPAASRFVSDPPAQPAAYLHRVTVNIGTASLGRSMHSPDFLSGFVNTASNAAAGALSIVGRDFIANRPFIFTLIDTKTRVTLFMGVYSSPDNQ